MAPGGGEYTLTSSPTYVNVGEHTVYYQVSGKSNGRVLQGKEIVNITGLPGSLTLNRYSVSLVKGNSTTVTATNKSGGNVTASSSSTGVATVSKSGNTFTITAVGAGSCTISFSGAAAGGYNGASASMSVTVIDCPPGNFSTASSWSDVQTIVRMGRAATQFSVGQTRTVNLSSIGAGTATITLVDIASDGKSIICMFTKYSGTIPAYCMRYSQVDDDDSWESTSMRWWLGHEFYDELSEDLKSVIADTLLETGVPSHGHYGSSSNQTTIDKLWLPAMKEIFGADYGCTTAEYNALTQFAYFKNGGSTALSDGWWLRSPATYSGNNFYYVTDNYAYKFYASLEFDAFPCFTIK